LDLRGKKPGGGETGVGRAGFERKVEGKNLPGKKGGKYSQEREKIEKLAKIPESNYSQGMLLRGNSLEKRQANNRETFKTTGSYRGGELEIKSRK